MAAKQDSDDEMDDITEDIGEGDGIDDLLVPVDAHGNGETIRNITARRRIEELLEERRLREQIEDYRDWE
jgi:hypothetical protein